MGIFLSLLLFAPLCFTGLYAQESPDRSTIPELLRQPRRGEASRYPVDMVIGSLERGDIPAAAYVFAREVLAALVTENGEAPALSSMNDAEREKLISDLGEISPRKYRLGNGREEADGAVSFLIRFMGRERGIAGELYVRATEAPAVEAPAGDETPAVPAQQNRGMVWQVDDIILEEERSLDEVIEDPLFDFPPYERFF
jgi:hypothetical protein